MDSSILQRIADGDELAVKLCLDTYGPIIWSMASRMLPTKSDAEDVVQEVFVELWKNAYKFDVEKASEKTFVAMIARRRIIDFIRKWKPDQNQGSEFEEAELVGDFTPALDRMEMEDDVRQAQDCLEELEQEDRKVIVHSIYRGLSQSEIAAKTGMPLGTVKTRARRGLLSLKDCMGSKSQSLHKEGVLR